LCHELIISAPFNIPRWPLASSCQRQIPGKIAFPGRHSRPWLSNLKYFRTQLLTHTYAKQSPSTHTLTHIRTHRHNYNITREGSILTGQERNPLQGCRHRNNPSVMSAFPFDTHLPSYPWLNPPFACLVIVITHYYALFPSLLLFLLKLSSNLHIAGVDNRRATDSRRAAVSACCPSLASQGIACDAMG